MFQLINRIRGIHIMSQYYFNKLDIGKIIKGSIWSRSKYQPVYICLQYPEFMIDTAGILDRKIFLPYKGKEFSSIVLGTLYKNGDPKVPFMRHIDTPNIVGETIGVVDHCEKKNWEDMDFLIQKNVEIEQFLFYKK